MEDKIETGILEKKIVKRNGKYCIVHCRSSDAGKIIKCFAGTTEGYKQALKMHYAIMANKYKEATPKDLEFLIKYSIMNGYDNEAVRYIDVLAVQKEEGKTDLSIKFKTGTTLYENWKRIRKRLNNKTIALLLLEPAKYEKLEDTLINLKALKEGYKSYSKPYYRFELPTLIEDLKHLGWDEKDLVVDTKIDGLRLTLNKIGGLTSAFVDPEDLKRKSSNVSDRLPLILQELYKAVPDNTVLDCELYSATTDIAHHRTVINGILNTKEDADKFQDYIYVFVFDIIYYKGNNIADLPLNNRLALLAKFTNTKHIKFEDISVESNSGSQAYIIKAGDMSRLKQVVSSIIEGRHGLQKGIQEGIMIKLFDHKYEAPQNRGWAKGKLLHEIDAIAYNRTLVKGQTSVWNYDLAIRVDEDYFNKLPEKIRLKLYDKYYFSFGRSDNSKLDITPSSETVLRIASEEVNKFENENHPEAPWYRGYINVVMQEVPEKNTSDSLDVLEKLSKFQPRRLSVLELAKLKNLKFSDKTLSVARKVEAMPDDLLIKLSKKLEIESG